MFNKQVACGFNGYQVPPTPRATRTPRKRTVPRRKTNENQLCAFDLLPTVALNLLVEGNEKHLASLKDSIKKEEHNTDKPLNAKLSFFGSKLVNRTRNLNNYTEEHPDAQGNAGCGPASVKTTSDCSVKIDSPEQRVSDGDKFLLGSSTRRAGNEVSVSEVSASCKLDCENKAQIKNESADKGKVSVRSLANMCNPNGLVTVNTNPSLLVNSDRSIKFPSIKDHISGGFFSVNREGVKLGTRDDDENSWCKQSNTVNNAIRPCNEDRNSVSSHCSKVPDTKDGHKTDMKDEHRNFDADMDRRHFSQDNKHSFKGERPLSDYPIKKRKLYEYSSLNNSSGGTNGEDCDSTPKGSHRNGPASLGTLAGVTGTPASSTIEQTLPRCRDSHVKLKIKSLHVPELFIEIPEAATVASLKTAVMEAVTAILGNGIHVGVLIQGKKIRDDNRTLLQTGISDINKPDALGFMLEPNHSPAPASVYAKGHPFVRVCESSKPLARYVDAHSLVHSSEQHKAAVMSTDVPESNITNHESAPSPPDMSQEKSSIDSWALIPVTPTNVESLNVVPMRKPKRSEFAQRRIRRPFTVSEVEALVHAVEKLGTGRWRDVKMWAFGNAKHRTYVDLKDKWKTLVHTARISPQQRRGYPVPQELLDRVLLAHAYWSQQEAKQQLKRNSRSSPSPLKVKFVETPQSHFLMKGDYVVG